MFLTAHVSYSVIINFVLFRLLGWDFDVIFLGWSALAGVLPDFDGLYNLKALLKHGFRHGLEEHRSYVSHSPFFWLLFFIILYFVAPVKIVLTMASGVLLHLFMDSIEEINGIRWLAPYSQRFLSFLKLKIKPEEWMRFYWSKWYNIMVETVGVAGVIIILMIMVN
jgi:hypothetical protein